MQNLMQTLNVVSRVGESVTGSSKWSPRYEKVSIGRGIPSLKKPEDAVAFLRCGFVDIGLPFEVNLVQSESIRTMLRQRVLGDPVSDGWLDPEALLRDHPSIGYLPPELLCAPNVIGLCALAGSGPSGAAISAARLATEPNDKEGIDWSAVSTRDFLTDAEFWSRLPSDDLYPRLIGDLLERGKNVRLTLLAPPVPVLHEDWSRSAEMQYELNAAAAILARPPPGSASNIRPLYSLHVHPSALRQPAILRSAVDRLRLAFAGTDFGFMGVHLSFTDVGAIAAEGAPGIRVAKDFAAKVLSVANESGRMSFVSDTGPVGPAFLDLGASFSTYGLGMTMRRTYPFMQAPKEQSRAVKKRVKESRYGMVLGGPWNYVLLRYRDVRAQDWKLEELTGKAGCEVPENLRAGPDDRYRVDFSKPYNVAVQEVLNDSRDRELNVRKNARPGLAVLGRSEDPSIAPWAQ